MLTVRKMVAWKCFDRKSMELSRSVIIKKEVPLPPTLSVFSDYLKHLCENK